MKIDWERHMDRKNEKTEIKRVKPDPKTGLNDLQVNERLHTGHYNKESSLPTKSYGRIVRDNVCTLFNLINIVLAAAVLYVGSYKNMLFMGVVLCNIAIGIFQAGIRHSVFSSLPVSWLHPDILSFWQRG